MITVYRTILSHAQSTVRHWNCGGGLFEWRYSIIFFKHVCAFFIYKMLQKYYKECIMTITFPPPSLFDIKASFEDPHACTHLFSSISQWIIGQRSGLYDIDFVVVKQLHTYFGCMFRVIIHLEDPFRTQHLTSWLTSRDASVFLHNVPSSRCCLFCTEKFILI